MSMMIFGTLFFSGLFLMFVFILFGQEKLIKQMRKEFERQNAQLERLEQRLVQYEQGGKKNVAPKLGQPVGMASSFAPVGSAGVATAEADLSLSMKEKKGPVGVQDGGLDLFMAPPQR